MSSFSLKPITCALMLSAPWASVFAQAPVDSILAPFETYIHSTQPTEISAPITLTEPKTTFSGYYGYEGREAMPWGGIVIGKGHYGTYDFSDASILLDQDEKNLPIVVKSQANDVPLVVESNYVSPDPANEPLHPWIRVNTASVTFDEPVMFRLGPKARLADWNNPIFTSDLYAAIYALDSGNEDWIHMAQYAPRSLIFNKDLVIDLLSPSTDDPHVNDGFFTTKDLSAFVGVNVKTRGNVFIRAPNLKFGVTVQSTFPTKFSFEGPGKNIVLNLKRFGGNFVGNDAPLYGRSGVDLNTGGGANLYVFSGNEWPKYSFSEVEPTFFVSLYKAYFHVLVDNPASRVFLGFSNDSEGGFDQIDGSLVVKNPGAKLHLALRHYSYIYYNKVDLVPEGKTPFTRDSLVVSAMNRGHLVLDAYSPKPAYYYSSITPVVSLNDATVEFRDSDADEKLSKLYYFMGFKGKGELYLPFDENGRQLIRSLNGDSSDTPKLTKAPILTLDSVDGKVELLIGMKHYQDGKPLAPYPLIYQGLLKDSFNKNVAQTDILVPPPTKDEIKQMIDPAHPWFKRVRTINALYLLGYDLTPHVYTLTPKREEPTEGLEDEVNFDFSKSTLSGYNLDAIPLPDRLKKELLSNHPVVWWLSNVRKLAPRYEPSDLVNTLMGVESANLATLQTLNDTLYDRLGSIREPIRGDKAEGLWVRTKVTQSQRTGLFGFKSQTQTMEVGFDRRVEINRTRFLLGLSYQWQRSSIKTDRTQLHNQWMGLGLYGSYLSDNNFYVDVVGRLGRFSVQDKPIAITNWYRTVDRIIEPTSLNRPKGLSLSAEVGRRWYLGHKKTFFVEPEAQLSYASLGSRRLLLREVLEDGQINTWVGHSGPTKSLVGRVGLALGKIWLDEQKAWLGMGYVRVNVNRSLMGKVGLYLRNGEIAPRLADIVKEPVLDLTLPYKKTWISVDLGGTRNFNHHWVLYGDGGYAFKGIANSSWHVDLGVRYSF